VNGYDATLQSTTEQRRDEMSGVLQKSEMPCERSASNDDLVTVSQIAEFLQVPDSWVYERTRRRGIERLPHFKLGKYLRFSRSEVLDWVQRQRGNSLAPR
jgi:excisionase family DNA binding protein